MTTRRDPEALLTAYLAGGMEVLPDRVVDSVMGEIHRTRQQTVLRPWRIRSASRTTLVAAAVVAMLALGGVFLVVGGDPIPMPSPEPSASLPGVVPPSAAPSEPSALPTSSAVTSPNGLWIATGTMGTPRSDHTAVRLLDGKVLVVGGSGGESDPATAELYDPNSGTWTATGTMLNPREGFPATLLRDGNVLVGDITYGAAGAEVYDPERGTWSATGPMRGSGVTATLLRDGTVLVTGNSGAQLYDPDRGTWTAAGQMINPRHSHAAILLPDGDVLVAGGHAPGDDPTDSAELYDPDTATWTRIASMHAPREVIAAFLQPDGTVLVIGSSRGDPLSAELYDPATGAWTATADTPRPRALVGTSTTQLSDGTVLVTGESNSDSRPLAELFDPGAASWTTAAPMLRSHGIPAVLLQDGTVLLAGGNDCLDGVCVATGVAELFIPAGVSPPPLPAFPSPPPPVIPSPTPIPTVIPPAAGPIPPSARPWTVTVDNRSSEPATLFVAEEDGTGMSQLVGSVTPNAVPPRTTMQVTFALPPEGVDGWWIFVNPGPNGALLSGDEVPLEGEVRIDSQGQVGWLSP